MVRLHPYFYSIIRSYSSQVLYLTCYFKHIKNVFEKAGVEPTTENKKEIDKVIHSLLGVEYKNCSQTWKAVKAKLAEDEVQFIEHLRAAL